MTILIKEVLVCKTGTLYYRNASYANDIILIIGSSLRCKTSRQLYSTYGKRYGNNFIQNKFISLIQIYKSML